METRGLPFSFIFLEKGFIMKLKTINTNSTGYNLVREGYALLAGAGSVTAVTSVVRPFVDTVWKGRPVWRFLGIIGTITLSSLAGVYGSSVGAVTVDSFANTYNLIADRVNGTKNAEPDKDEPKPEDNVKMYREDITILNDYIVETKMFEFDSEEEAKKALEWMTNMLNNGIVDFMDIAGYYAILRSGKMPENKKLYDIVQMYGWTKDDTKKWFVEQADENTWMFGAMNYHDISDKLVVSKERELNKIADKMSKEK